MKKDLLYEASETTEHVERVANITKFLISKLSNDQVYINLVSEAARYHDAGKMMIDKSILYKPNKLTSEEFEYIKTHTKCAKNVIDLYIPKEDKIYKYVCDIARHHHERFDGNGYPDNLKGDEISIESQIVGLADVIDALVSKRCYKQAIDFEKSINMITNNECGVFNPKIIELLNNNLEELKKIIN